MQPCLTPLDISLQYVTPYNKNTLLHSNINMGSPNLQLPSNYTVVCCVRARANMGLSVSVCCRYVRLSV